MMYQAIREYPALKFGRVVPTWQESFDDLLRLTDNKTSHGHIKELYRDAEIARAQQLEHHES